MKFIQAKTIISGYVENNPWFGINYNMNIYKGCCHGCIYCDSRSECYHVDNFDEVRAKENAHLLHSPVLMKITITAADDELCKKIKPNAPLSSERFAAIKELTDQGIFAGILLMPVLPFIEDNNENIKNIIELSHENGAKFIYPAFGVTLRQNQRDWYFNKLDKIFPGIKEKYIKQYGNSYECRSTVSKELWKLFVHECNKYGIIYKMNDIIKEYKQGYGNKQFSIFD